MSAKYPILLVHGIMLKDFGRFKAFGKIEKTLRSQGYTVYTSDADALAASKETPLNSRRNSEIVDFMAKKTKKEKIYGFYLELCRDLADRGF